MSLMTILIVLGALVVGAGLLYAAWRFGKEGKNPTVIIALAAIGPVVNALKDAIPNKEGVDASEILGVVGKLASGASAAISDPAF
jgi:flagellar basal body-associated protein FliL